MSRIEHLAFLPAHELAIRMRRREIKAVELLETYLDRIERLDGPLNAVVVRDAERALERAHKADKATKKDQTWGPLHGVPVTVKESFDVEGLPTTWGHEAQRGNIARGHAAAVQRLVDAGAIVFGKTNVPTALADWQTFNPVYGTTNNPWNLKRTPGGSSGGSAAALAAGLTALELGSDIGASIRNPAHYCGVWGHKPTWGLVPLAGHGLPGDHDPDATDLAVAGPLARSARDLALAMDVLTSPLERWTPEGRIPVRWKDPGTPASRLRVAVIYDDPLAETDSSVCGLIEALLVFMANKGIECGMHLKPVDSEECWATYVHLLRAATGAKLDDAAWDDARRRAAATDPAATDYGSRHWRASTMSHREWAHWNHRRDALRRQWDAFFRHWDLVVTPIATTTAFRHNQQGFRWERILEVNGRSDLLLQPTTQALFWAGYPSVVGLPATAVPLGLSVDGLPIGCQIIGPAFADPMCLRLAAWIEEHFHGFEMPPAFAVQPPPEKTVGIGI